MYCSHIILCNILTTILRPNFEDPINTAQDLLDQNVELLDIPGGDVWKNFLLTSPNENYRKLGETMYLAETWEEFDEMSIHEGESSKSFF